MKKTLTGLLAVVLSFGILAGCSGGKTNAPSAGESTNMKEGQSVQTVVDQINEQVGISMPADLDDGLLKDLFYIDAADTEAYAGKMAMTMTSADNVVAVKAKPDKKQVVVDSLNKRLDDVRKSFEQYLPDQSEKAKKGQVIEKGDYVFLLILGESEDTFDKDMEKAVEIINSAF